MARGTIRFVVEGAAAESGHVRLADFLQQLSDLNGALKAADRAINAREQPTLYYRIVDLSHSSPATVEIEPVNSDPEVDTRGFVVPGFLSALEAIETSKPMPRWVNSGFLRKVKGFSKPVGRSVHKVQVLADDSTVAIDASFQSEIDKLLAKEDSAFGSVEGRLEQLNVHAGANNFKIYPTVGASSVTCHFPAKLEHTAINSVKRWITVHGRLIYNERDRYPARVEATDIEVHPTAEDLPSLSDIKGTAPAATGKKKSEVFVRNLRNEWI